jgi:uncharacterized membrane protein YcaP (DUF421 family)
MLKNGEWQARRMRQQQISDDDVMAMARDQGLENLDQIEYAVLERNGELVIIPVQEE